MKLKTYIVRFSPHHTVKARAYTAQGARAQAWKTVEGGYKYGWKSKADFMRNAKVEQE
jgi:hypothetical protein